MQARDNAGLAVLTAAVVVAAGLGWHGVRHPGPVLSAASGGPGSGATVVTVPSGAAQSGAGTRPQHHSAHGGSKAVGQGQGAGGQGTGAGGTSGGAAKGSAGSSTPASTLTPTTTLLSQTQYAPYAVPVYPHEAAGASQALSGFALKITPDGPLSERLEVFIAGTTQAALNQVIARSDKVYFVEGSMGDDGPGMDTNGGDDGLVVTNAKGYILQ